MTGGLKRISRLSAVQFIDRETASLLILCKNSGKAGSSQNTEDLTVRD